MNEYEKKILHRKFELVTFRTLAFRNPLKSTKNFRFPILCRNALKTKKNKMPGYRYHTDLRFLLTLLKVRFRGKKGFYLETKNF